MKIAKKLHFELSQELRLKNNSSALNSTFTEMGFKYKLLKNLDGGIYYRFTITPDGFTHRPFADVSYEIKMHDWTIEPRLRYQHQEELNKIAKNYIRAKVTVSYAINKHWEPYMNGEIYYHAFYYKGSQFDEYRVSTGMKYDLSKEHAFKIFYLFGTEFNVNNALQAQVAGISYEYDF